MHRPAVVAFRLLLDQGTRFPVTNCNQTWWEIIMPQRKLM